MFDVGFNPMATPLSGFSMYVMDSAETTDKVIKDFELAVMNGVAAEDALTYALEVNNAKIGDLTFTDREKLTRRVEEISNSSFNTKERNRY